jgi:hypothetical protein
MKGPVRVKHFCGEDIYSVKKEEKNCEYLKFMHYYYICTKTNTTINLEKVTPKDCPYLLKAIRNEKLEKINESGRNL